MTPVSPRLIPADFLVAEFGGEPAATISCVNYSDSFAFLGFYIVRPDLRGRGYGLRIWNEAIAHAGRRVIGLDGVVAQQGNYRKSGFAYAYANIRYGGVVSAPAAIPAGIVALDEIPLTRSKPPMQPSSPRRGRRSCAPGSAHQHILVAD